MKSKIVRSIKVVLFAFLFPFLDFVTLHRTCNWLGDDGPEYYGLPFVWRTQIPWVNSLTGQFYILGFLGNVLFYFLLAFLVSKLFIRLNMGAQLSKFIRISSTVLVIFFSIIAIMFVSVIDWNYQTKDDRAKFEKATGKKLNCDCEIDFFKF